MPIGTQYRNNQIQPGVVHLHGQVIVTAAPIIDTALTFTPGITATRTGTGLYTLTFNDGVTVGFSAINFTSIVAATGVNPFLFAVVGTGLAAGSSAIALEVNDVAGTLVDPAVGEGFAYDLVRLNTSVVVQ